MSIRRGRVEKKGEVLSEGIDLFWLLAEQLNGVAELLGDGGKAGMVGHQPIRTLGIDAFNVQCHHTSKDVTSSPVRSLIRVRISC